MTIPGSSPQTSIGGCNSALAVLQNNDISALIVIGGNGSQTGATTAVEVALEAIDRLRTTASSMKRALALQQYVKQHSDQLGFDLRVTKLGHIQRGGAPGAFDRMLELAGLLAM
jgi:6-phosphofructokinase